MLAMDIKLDGDGIWSDLEDGKRPIHRVDDGVLRICTLEGVCCRNDNEILKRINHFPRNTTAFTYF